MADKQIAHLFGSYNLKAFPLNTVNVKKLSVFRNSAEKRLFMSVTITCNKRYGLKVFCLPILIVHERPKDS